MSLEVRVPVDLWEEDEDGALSTWFYGDDDQVSEGAVVCEVMVAKVQLEILAPTSGTVRIVAPVESVVRPGDLIARIEPS